MKVFACNYGTQGALQSLQAAAVMELGWNITMRGLEKKNIGVLIYMKQEEVLFRASNNVHLHKFVAIFYQVPCFSTYLNIQHTGKILLPLVNRTSTVPTLNNKNISSNFTVIY